MRVMKWVADVYSCTSSPACVWRVPLVTVPDRRTVAPGAAYCGFIASMVIERPPVAVLAAGLASAEGTRRRGGRRQDGGHDRRRYGENGGQGQRPPSEFRR